MGKSNRPNSKDEVISIMDKAVLNRVYNDYQSEKDFYIHFIKLFYTYDNPDYNRDELYSVCIEHGYRVLKNSMIIMDYHEKINYRHYTKNERTIVKIAAIFHDIGKVYKKKKHEKWSFIIMNELFKKKLEYHNETRLTKRDISKILEIINMHGNKTEFRDDICILCKIVRDADSMDETCGDSLVDLALANIIKSNSEYNGFKQITNLNKLSYKYSDLVMEDMNSDYQKNRIKRKLNILVNYDLYVLMLNYANEEYDKRTQYHRNRGKYEIQLY